MSSEQAAAPKAADGQSLPERPAKQPKVKAAKDKGAKGSKTAGLEVCP